MSQLLNLRSPFSNPYELHGRLAWNDTQLTSRSARRKKRKARLTDPWSLTAHGLVRLECGRLGRDPNEPTVRDFV